MTAFTHPRILLLLLLLLLLIEFYFSLIFLDSYDQTPPLHSLMRISMTVFTCSRTTRCPWIGPPA